MDLSSQNVCLFACLLLGSTFVSQVVQNWAKSLFASVSACGEPRVILLEPSCECAARDQRDGPVEFSLKDNGLFSFFFCKANTTLLTGGIDTELHGLKSRGARMLFRHMHCTTVQWTAQAKSAAILHTWRPPKRQREFAMFTKTKCDSTCTELSDRVFFLLLFFSQLPKIIINILHNRRSAVATINYGGVWKPLLLCLLSVILTSPVETKRLRTSVFRHSGMSQRITWKLKGSP